MPAFADNPEPSPVVRTANAKNDQRPHYDDYFMSAEHRKKIYEESRKSPTRAVLWTLAFPGLGNIYAEQYLLAGLAISFMAFAAVFVGYGLSTHQPKIVTLGGITAGIAYVGGGTTSLIGVAQYNRKLREGLKIEQTNLHETWGPTLAFRF